jgi:fermentation-respiration switch protein FrsA (DUF1100 family)
MRHWIADLFVWSGTRARPVRLRRTPAAYGVPFENVHFPSAHADCALLSAWLLPAISADPRGIVLLCHGHGSTRAAMLDKALMLRRHHLTTLLFDFRARGMSQGERCTLGLRETEDVLGAVRYLAGRSDTAQLPLFALGESMGGAAALLAAARCSAIRAVVAEAAFASLDQAVHHHLKWIVGPFAPSLAASCRHIGKERLQLDIAAVAPENVIASISPRPILLIQDGFDPVCPARESERLFAAAREPKARWIVRGAPHCEAFWVARREYERRVSAFFTECATG